MPSVSGFGGLVLGGLAGKQPDPLGGLVLGGLAGIQPTVFGGLVLGGLAGIQLSEGGKGGSLRSASYAGNFNYYYKNKMTGYLN